MKTSLWQLLPACACLEKVIKAKENFEVQPYKKKQFRIVFPYYLKRGVATEQIGFSTFWKLKFVFPCGLIFEGDTFSPRNTFQLHGAC